jgi:nitroreductase
MVKSEELKGLFESRYSGRSYDSSRDLTEDQLDSLIYAASLAPSCYNEQPWRFLITHKNRSIESYQLVFNSLVEFNQNWAQNAPILIVSIAGLKFAKNGKPNRWGPYDTGAAAFAMMLQATTMGLMAHQMGGFDEKLIKKSFNISDEYTPIAVMAVGYETKGEEPIPKDREPLENHFFKDSWKG